MTTSATLRALAAELCEAKEGSRDLDARIAVAVNHRPDNAPDWLRKNFSTTRVCSPGRVEVVHTGRGRDGKGGVHWEVPRYTTSLDAKLPGEDIVLVAAPGYMISGNIGSDTRWMAQQRNAANCRSKAHTEPLARRAAGLLAMAQEKESA